MKSLHTFTALGLVPSAQLNAIQAAALDIRQADTNNALTAMARDCGGIAWNYAATLSTGTLISVDTSIDWRDRMVWGLVRALGDAGRVPGGVVDHQFDIVGAPTAFLGYTGVGAEKSGGGAPSAGNPPVQSASAPASYVAVLSGTMASGLLLYMDKADSVLKIYNTGAAAVGISLVLFYSGDAGER